MFAVKMDECLLHGDSSQLVSLLRYEGLTSITLTRLDQLVTKELCGFGFSKILVVLKSLNILSEDKGDLQTLIDHGLVVKVLLWFEAIRDLLTSDLHRSSAPLLSLAEEFYDYFLLLGQASLAVSQLSVVLLQLAQVALQTEIHFPLRLEAIRTFNSLLESLSRDQRRLIQNDQNLSQILSQVAAAVLTVGDYELQVSLSEALCRLTPRKDRENRASQWFPSLDVSKAFCDIRDGDFEVDCRRFLNFVNCYNGEHRRVYTFPCFRAFLDSTQLFRPKDDKLDEFWIDFNLDSGCVSFFIDEPQGFLWGSVHLLREDVNHYSLQVKDDASTGAEVVLSVQLNNPIMHHNIRSQRVELCFSCEHQRDVEEAASRVFMRVKSSPCVKDPGGTVQLPPYSDKRSRCYSRKKPQSKSQLKILPLSSPSSEDDSSAPKAARRNRAEFLFDQIQMSSPSYRSGICVGKELQNCQQETEFGGSSSPLKREVSSLIRKRSAQDSGYLSDHNGGTTAQKRKAEPIPEGEESSSVQMEHLQEGLVPQTEEEEVFTVPCVEREGPVNNPEAEPHCDLTSGITAAFKNFKEQLEQHFAVCWKKVEAEVLLSLKTCQQHVFSLLSAVHQHRLLLLQRFENSVTDQLNRLEENSTNLNSLNTQILSFFQSEVQRLSSFCDEHQQKLKALEEGGVEKLSGR